MRTLIAHPDQDVGIALASLFAQKCRGPADQVPHEELADALKYCGPYDAFITASSYDPRHVQITGICNYFGRMSEGVVVPEASIEVPLISRQSRFIKQSLHAALAANGHRYPVIETGPFKINVDTQSATVYGAPVKLTEFLFDLLTEIALHRNKLMDKADLMQLLYNPDREPDGNTLQVHMSKLRKAIRAAGGTGNEILTTADAYIIPDDDAEDENRFSVAGPFTINEDTRLGYFNGSPIKATPMEFNLLDLLVHKAGTTVTRKQIIQFLYDGDDARMEDDDSNIEDVFLSKLRKRIVHAGGTGKEIETVRGKGYRLGGDPAHQQDYEQSASLRDFADLDV